MNFLKTYKKNDSGFTLLELMISLAIFGIMIFILMAVLRLGFRAVEAGEKKIDVLERARASLNIIDSQIQSEFPILYEEKGEKKYNFKGGRDFLEFTTNYSIWGGETGYVVVSYQVVEGVKGKQALMASENKVGLGNKEALKLLDFFDSLYFEYFYKDPTAEEGKWIDQWTESTLMPEKIKLHLITGGKDISLIFPLRASGGGGTSVGIAAQRPSPTSKQPQPTPVPGIKPK